MTIDLIDQPLWISCKGGHFSTCAKHQEMVPGRLEAAVVDFFADEEQNPLMAITIITIEPLDKDIVVCGDDRI